MLACTQLIQRSVDSYRQGRGIDTMTTSGVGCKRRSLSPSSAASLPNSFGLVANQVADTAIVRRGGFLPLFPRSFSKPAESSGSMLPQRTPSGPNRWILGENFGLKQRIDSGENTRQD